VCLERVEAANQTSADRHAIYCHLITSLAYLYNTKGGQDAINVSTAAYEAQRPVAWQHFQALGGFELAFISYVRAELYRACLLYDHGLCTGQPDCLEASRPLASF